MGYACPVCGDPQADAGHLANHLAFTAMASGGDHEEWLDEHVPGWGQRGESELAAAVTDEAEETEFPQVFEASNLAEGRDGGGHGHGGDHGEHGHDHGAHDHGVDPAAARARGRGEMDEEARQVLAEAREITEEMRGSNGDDVDEGPDADDGSDADEGPDTDEGPHAGDREESAADETE